MGGKPGEILLTMFISTIFFSIYYPPDSTCSIYHDVKTCLSLPSKILSGHSECSWDSANHLCYVEPPPKSVYFIISVSIMTTIIFAPFDLLFFLILNCICSRRPELEKIGLDSFNLLGSGDVASSTISSYDIADEEIAITSILKAFRHFEQRYQRGACTNDELRKTEKLLRRFGMKLSDGRIVLTFLSALRFRSNIRSCVGHHVRRARSAALILLTNAQCYPDQLEKGIYLAQVYILEHFDYLTQTSLKRAFLHFTAEHPLTIHPVPWLIAWLFELGCIVFFIFWILKWGDTATIDTVASWSTNFVLSLAQEIFIVSVIRILAINVLVIEWART